ncbi:MAG: GNAT family N-acetyltransferase [Verrucomicrobiaceae bacterium]|nr:GNAT family N-acetyltransferase [Verrucomicrobiaceae bacterium]
MPEVPHQPLGEIVANWREPPFPAREVMHGRFCRLEPLEAAKHARSLFDSYALDPHGSGWTYLPYGPFEVFEDFRVWLEQQSGTRDPLFFAIVDRASGEAVGLASYLRISPSCGSIEVGHLHFSPKLQRTPAATEAMYLMMRHAFELGYRRYEWKCDSLNEASRKAALRLGLSFEGIFRQATVRKGRNRDTAWYAAIDKDWPALRAAFERWLSPSNFDAQGRQRVSLSSLTRAA